MSVGAITTWTGFSCGGGAASARTKMLTRPVLVPEGLVAVQVYSPSSDLRTEAILSTPSVVGT